MQNKKQPLLAIAEKVVPELSMKQPPGRFKVAVLAFFSVVASSQICPLPSLAGLTSAKLAIFYESTKQFLHRLDTDSAGGWASGTAVVMGVG